MVAHALTLRRVQYHGSRPLWCLHACVASRRLDFALCLGESLQPDSSLRDPRNVPSS